MKKIDLLFIHENPINYAHICDEFLEDIEFSCFRNLLSNDEYDFFSRIIAKPLSERDKISERQSIFRDLMKYQRVAESLIAICDRAQNNKMPKDDLVYRSIPSKRKLIEYLKVIKHTLDVPDELLSVVRDRDFESATLINLRKQLEINDDIEILKARLDNLVNNLLNDNISLQIEFGKTFKLKSASVFSSGLKVSTAPKTIFHKKQNTIGSSYGYDFIAALQIEQMLDMGVKNISYIMYQLNSHILSYCRDLSIQLSFYITGIKIIKYLQSTGATVDFPNISVSEDEIRTKGLLDVGLIVKRGTSIDVIPNDFNSKKGAFYLISGVNQGGKTTFLKSVGVAQIFAQNGLPVAAIEYSCPLFENFVSHFPRGEDNQLCSGKLEEELSRFKHDLPLMAKKALILMNESFATTTEKEGAEIAVDTLRALSLSKPLLFFVTHNYILLKNRNEYSREFKNSILLRSLVTIKGSSSTERTYKLVEGEPQEEINTIEFLKEKYIK